jgi:hypothetical protein
MRRMVPFAVLVVSSIAAAQITAIPQFAGVDSEGFETQPPQGFSSCVQGRVFNNKGDLCVPANPNGQISSGWGFACMMLARTGSYFYGSAGGYAEYTFDSPAQRFGGWFGTNTGTPDAVARFYDVNGALLATKVVTIPANCGWTWNGWDAGGGPAIKRVQIEGNNPAGAGGFAMMDDMQLSPFVGAGNLFCFADGSNSSLIPCPCANTGSAGHGCDNSGATGGARLAATGAVSPDTIVLTSTGEMPVAPSVFLQGTATIATGAVFGDGVRCAAGILKRLKVKPASGGVVAYPTAGDPSITTQSAALGDPLAPGTTRYYQTYYRDPDPTFCPVPTGNTWNVSSGVIITW